MEKIIFRASNSGRFQAPALSNRARLACLLYACTRIQTETFKAARRAYFQAWNEHSEQLQAELDEVRTARAKKQIYKYQPWIPAARAIVWVR